MLEPRLSAREPGSFLHRRCNAYLFTAGRGTLDLVAFRELVSAARAAAGQAALDLYVEAVGLGRGPAGGGVATGTAAALVFAALDGEFHDACVEAAEVAVSLGWPERVLPALQLAASMAPLHEPMHAGHFRVLGAADR